MIKKYKIRRQGNKLRGEWVFKNQKKEKNRLQRFFWT